MGSLQNQVRDFKGLAQKLLCYRYTIPQELLNDISILDGHSGNARSRIRKYPAFWRPSTRYLPPLASGQGWRCCRRAGKSRVIVWRRPRSGLGV